MAQPHADATVWSWLVDLAVRNDAAYLKWFVQTVLFAVFSLLTFRIPWSLLRFAKSVSDDNMLFFKGYLYHFATAPVRKDILRRTILRIRPGLQEPIVVQQFNEVPARKMYWGCAEIVGEALSIAMKSKRSGAKLLNIYTLRRLGGLTFSMGQMSGINHDGDPWSVPVLLTSRPLPAKQLAPILEKLAKRPVSKRVRSEVETLLRALPPESNMGSINHPWGTDAEQKA